MEPNMNMTGDLLLLWPVVMANFAICAGYLTVSLAVAFSRYRFVFVRQVTRAAGALFFVTCGLHHLMNALTLVFQPHAEFFTAMLTPSMFLIDATQAIAVWVFALSAGAELWDIAQLRAPTLPPTQEPDHE